ncbi:MAG: hypothetical protein K2K89_00315 [Ruminococcus sp.]|nr:hypothetical protein [Ruminococcus sp.]
MALEKIIRGNPRLKCKFYEVIKIPVDIDDFLIKCRRHGIESEYNYERTIDLKFRLDGQHQFGKLELLQKEIDFLKKKKQAVVTLLKHKSVFDELKTLLR